MEILEFAKHRYPFLLIDKVVDYEYMQFAICVKNVSYNEPWVQGHYPDKAVYPGVLLIESMAQASAPLVIKEGEQNDSHTGYLAQIDRVKFIRPVVPGDQLVLESKPISRIDNYYIIQCVATVDGKKVAQAKMSYVIKEDETHD